MSRKYAEIKSELVSVMEELQQEDIDIEQAIILHKKAKELLVQLEKRLKQSSVEVQRINKSTNDTD